MQISTSRFEQLGGKSREADALGISLLSSGLTVSEVAAPIGILIGYIDLMDGFDSFYEWLDANNLMYDETRGVIVPINGIPRYITIE